MSTRSTVLVKRAFVPARVLPPPHQEAVYHISKSRVLVYLQEPASQPASLPAWPAPVPNQFCVGTKLKSRRGGSPSPASPDGQDTLS